MREILQNHQNRNKRWNRAPLREMYLNTMKQVPCSLRNIPIAITQLLWHKNLIVDDLWFTYVNVTGTKKTQHVDTAL